MSLQRITLLLLALLQLVSCHNKIYTSNGEAIYQTGKNLHGERMVDKKASRIKFVSSCMNCHGKTGERMNNASIKFSALSDPRYYSIAYTESLFFRFLDKDIKSDGHKANIGVIWKMSDNDKKDLWNYLKGL